jgi:hypothetical protein
MLKVSPAGATAVANQLPILVSIKEKLCKPYCIDSTTQPQASVIYTIGTPVFSNTTVFLPITATVTIVTKGCGCKATTQLYTEQFDVAFQNQTGVPKSVTLTQLGSTQLGSDLQCGRAHSYSIYDSLVIKITPQSTALATSDSDESQS